jgi:UDP-glucose:glycoprotein glucosyltransferase
MQSSETAALEDSASFFPLLDTLTNPDEFTTPLPKLAPEAIYQAALSTIKAQGYLIDETEVKRFELALSLHVASPKLQAFYQFYEDKHLEREGKVLDRDGVAEQDCASWVDWYGTKICGADDLANVLAREGLEAGKNKPK